MSASLSNVFLSPLADRIQKSRILVVGAGGIGCEILKNLVLSGFPDIEIIDLDTIDLSNLNRQFLFHREHVGQSKAKIARESALQFNPDVKIKAYHDSIFSTDYGVNYFKKFDLVLNALDNLSARNHVNRMCLNAEVPLIESGTAGYKGQVELIKKGLTQCYECVQKPAPKTFPGCTIRNTPSEPIHCIVWAKHLFNQLFGETADDEDISPDVADPEAKNEDETTEIPEAGNVVRVSTRQWAKTIEYDPEQIFNKLFFDDINYLLSMSNLWKTRKSPTPLKWDSVLLQNNDGTEINRDYHKLWTLSDNAGVFAECVKKLAEKLTDNDALVWDKDDQPAMDFVAACANLRSYIFDIAQKTRFDIKAMAGNIIPAIATTNAITAGVVIMHVYKILEDKIDDCKSVYMRLLQNARQQIIVPDKVLTPPNPKCYVCAADPAIHLRIDTKRMTIKEFRDEVLIKALNMVNPDVMIDSKGIVVLSSEDGETEDNEHKLLSEMGIVDGIILKCDDFFQNYELSIIVIDITAERDEPLYEVIADKDTQIKQKIDTKIGDNVADSSNNGKAEINNDDDDGPSTSKRSRPDDDVVVADDDDDDDLLIIEDNEDDNNEDVVVVAEDLHEKDATSQVTEATDKLTVTDDTQAIETKTVTGSKRKPAPIEIDSDDVCEILDSDEDEGVSTCKRIRRATDQNSSSSDLMMYE